MLAVENYTVNEAVWRPIYTPLCHCDVCGADIYEGDDYYDFGGDTVCEDCKRDYVEEHFRKTG